MKLSVVVPCYNEGESVNEFYDVFSNTFKNKKISYELIMVDDGSTDATHEKLVNLAKEKKNVKVISFSRNFGKEAAMLAGLENASGEYVAIMDADLQHHPKTLLQMYEKLIDNPSYDVVAAYRENRNNENPLKKTLTAIFYRVSNIISEVKLLPGASDFRVFKASVAKAIIALPEKARFLKGIFSWVGFNTIYVPYTPEKRVHGSSKWSILKLIKYSIGGIISFSSLPLKVIFIVGVMTFIVGVVNFLLLGNLSFRVIILFVSFIMLSLGILSLYISRMYGNILGRPSYIIKEKIGFNPEEKQGKLDC